MRTIIAPTRAARRAFVTTAADHLVARAILDGGHRGVERPTAEQILCMLRRLRNLARARRNRTRAATLGLSVHLGSPREEEAPNYAGRLVFRLARAPMDVLEQVDELLRRRGL